jgi:hypothetical protein
MFPMLNRHLNKDDNLESEIKDNEDVKEIEENSDKEIESSSGDSGMPLCAKVGLGLLGATVIGFGICKILSNSTNENDDISNLQ